ncbi:MAG: hypothetical protein AB1670_03455 [Pseudomonadota bacterium]
MQIPIFKLDRRRWTETERVMPSSSDVTLKSGYALRACSALALAAVVSGCTTAYEGKYDYAKGWRPGVIIKIGTPTDLAPLEAMCSLAEMSSTARFAYVQFIFGPTHGKFFYSGPQQRHVIVPLPQGGGLHEGARVYINLQDCDQTAGPASTTTR